MANQSKSQAFKIQWRDNSTGNMAFQDEECQVSTIEEANKKVDELKKAFPAREYRIVPPVPSVAAP